KLNTRDAFVEAVGSALLLVRLDLDSELSITLEAALEDSSSTAGWRPDSTLGYDTAVLDLGTLGTTSTRPSFGGAELVRRLLRAVHFAVTLKKRRGAANVFSERISVGRARTNDI